MIYVEISKNGSLVLTVPFATDDENLALSIFESAFSLRRIDQMYSFSLINTEYPRSQMVRSTYSVAHEDEMFACLNAMVNTEISVPEEQVIEEVERPTLRNVVNPHSLKMLFRANKFVRVVFSLVLIAIILVQLRSVVLNFLGGRIGDGLFDIIALAMCVIFILFLNNLVFTNTKNGAA